MEWTKERHEAVKARCDAASPRPWGEICDYDYYLGGGYIVDENGGRICLLFGTDDDEAFIREARADLPDALAEIERLEARVAELENTTDQDDEPSPPQGGWALTPIQK